jgi:glycosyltransferase involved in cell wall biosynthesis
MDVLFYQDMLSPHQVATLAALAQRHGCRTTLAIQEEQQAARTALGWEKPDAGNVRVIILRDKAHAREVVRSASQDAIHVFSGTGAYPLVHAAFGEGCRLGRRLGVLSESPMNVGIAGRLRFFRELQRAWRFRDSISFFLATGHLGVEWFTRARYHSAGIFTWGYFVSDEQTERPANDRDSPFRFCFVGQMVRRKGLDILLRAAEALPSREWTLDVIGDGPLAGEMKIAEARLGSRQVRFHGVLPHKQAVDQIRQADMLILPSRWDGWGAVINEALLQGVRVVCTDRCGAAILVHSKAQGYVIPSGSVTALVRAMAAALREGRLSPGARDNLRAWSRCRILPEVAAGYLAEVLTWREGRTPPRAPWLAGDVVCRGHARTADDTGRIFGDEHGQTRSRASVSH